MPPDSRRPLGALLADATTQLTRVDPADTPAALQALWYGFCVAGAAQQILAVCADPGEYSPMWENARPVLAAAIGALRGAPSLPAGLLTELDPAGSPYDRIEEETARHLHTAVLALAAQLNTFGPEAARHARGADAKACRAATVLAAELYDCCSGRPRSFLNHARTSYGHGSFVVRGEARGPKRSDRRPRR